MASKLVRLIEAEANDREWRKPTQQDFWTFYMLAAAEPPMWGTDKRVEFFIDEFWTNVWGSIAEIAFGRIGHPLLVEAIDRMMSGESYNDDKETTFEINPDTYEEIVPEHDSEEYRLMMAAKSGSIMDLYNALRHARYLPEWELLKKHEVNPSRFNWTGATWMTLLDNVVKEFRKHSANGAAKAVSVDRMFGWAHHSGPVADYIGEWAQNALNLRADANVREMASKAAPWARKLMSYERIKSPPVSKVSNLLRNVYVELRREEVPIIDAKAWKHTHASKSYVQNVKIDGDAIEFDLTRVRGGKVESKDHVSIVLTPDGQGLKDEDGILYYPWDKAVSGRMIKRTVTGFVWEILLGRGSSYDHRGNAIDQPRWSKRTGI